MTMRVVVVGGDAAGATAASQIKRLLRDDSHVLMLERQNWTSYSACGIPYWVGGIVEGGPDALVARSPEQHRANGIDVRTATTVTRIDTDRRTVVATGPEGSQAFDYDHLVIATGAEPLTLPIPGISLPGIHRAQTLDDGLAALAHLDDAEHPVEHAIVIGAGYIGIEMAEAAMERGLKTCVIDLAPEPMTTMDPDMGTLIRKAMVARGVDVHTKYAVNRITARDGRLRHVVAGDTRHPADIVFLSVGVRPRTYLARDAGLPLGRSGGITVNEKQQVLGHDRIWAAGDCTETIDRLSGRSRFVPLGTHANKQARVLGLNVAGVPATFEGVVGTAVTRFMDLEIARTGLREEDALADGWQVRTATITASTASRYIPGSGPITVKMLGDAASGQLLGAQIVGAGGSAKRIDTVATALHAEMDVKDILDLDLAYAPPFSPVWDPVQVAARRLMSLL